MLPLPIWVLNEIELDCRLRAGEIRGGRLLKLVFFDPPSLLRNDTSHSANAFPSSLIPRVQTQPNSISSTPTPSPSSPPDSARRIIVTPPCPTPSTTASSFVLARCLIPILTLDASAPEFIPSDDESRDLTSGKEVDEIIPPVRFGPDGGPEGGRRNGRMIEELRREGEGSNEADLDLCRSEAYFRVEVGFTESSRPSVGDFGVIGGVESRIC